MSVAENYSIVAKTLQEYAIKYNNDPNSVTLLSVSKTHPVEKLLEVAKIGVRCFGESKVQEAIPKIDIVKSRYPNVEFHFIGRLQTNKVKKLVEYFSLIHSVDRLEGAIALNKAAFDIGKVQDILVQLNLAKEPQKNGIEEEHLNNFMETIATMENIRVRGFMLIPPLDEDGEHNRKYFKKAKEIYDIYKKNSNFSVDTLSMGMSDDFEIAVAEGSNMVRIGTMIFGDRLQSERL